MFLGAHYRIKVETSNSTESKKHGGEVGQLMFKMHSTRDGSGENSGSVALTERGYHGPGMVFQAVVPALAIKYLKTVEVEWKYKTDLWNPFTYRILHEPRVFISRITIDSLELKQR